MASYLTLAEYSQFLMTDGKLVSSGIVDILRKESFLLEKMQFPTLNALKAKNSRIKTLPTLQNRKLNASYTHSVGQIEPLEENAFLYGGRVDFDHQLEGGDGLITDPAAWNIKMYAESMAYGWNDDVINNTPGADPDAVTGLRYRFANDFTGQIVDAGGADISPDSAGLAAAFNTVFDAIQSGIYKCREHMCDLILTNDTMKLRIESGLRQLALYATTQDSFGRTITTWGEGGPMIVDMGTLADQSTKVMPDTEGATGVVGGGTKTSVMLVKLGQEYLTGWQKGPMQNFEWQTGVLKHVEMDWATGIFVTDPRSIAWVYNIQAI